jgi:hypothetical protein
LSLELTKLETGPNLVSPPEETTDQKDEWWIVKNMEVVVASSKYHPRIYMEGVKKKWNNHVRISRVPSEIPAPTKHESISFAARPVRPLPRGKETNLLEILLTMIR